MTEENTETVENPEKVLAELRRAQADLKELRKTLTALESERDTLKTKVESLSADEMRLRALKAETKVALATTGVKDADRLLKYVGTEGLDFDDEGNLTGLDERMKQLKTDLPELFDAKRRVGGKADIHANTTAEVQEDPIRASVHRALTG